MADKSKCDETEKVLDQFKKLNKEDMDESRFLDRSGGYDLTLIVEDQRIRVCKAVLCLASPVFHTMLKSDFREKDQAEIELPGKNYQDFVEFLLCVYPNKMKSVTGENVYRIIPLVVEYQVNALQDKCQDVLLKTVNDKCKNDETDQIYCHLQLAELYGLAELKSRCIQLASDLSLAEMDERLTAYPVSDGAVLKIQHLALQKKEQINELDQKDDEYLYKSNNTWVEEGRTRARCKDIIQNTVQSLSNSWHCSDILRAARLHARFLAHDKEQFLKIVGKLNEMKTRELAPYKKQLELLPKAIKKSLTVLWQKSD